MGKFKGYVIVAALAYVVGMAVVWKFRAPETKIEIQEKVVEKEVVKRDIVTRTIKLPDGTVKTEVVERQVSVKDSAKEKIDKKEVKSTSSKYSLSVSALLPIREPKIEHYEVKAGVRAAGPVWVEAGYITDKTITVGARVEF